jgi:DNA sulfur modification protein DndD
MKLLRAHIENFRLLKDIQIGFAVEPESNLTVIRAANESGKTTLLMALQWGLFGDDALPDRGKNFRLSPMDASSGSRSNVNVSVEIDYEVPTKTGPRQYRLLRYVTETVKGGEFERGAAHVKLFQLTATGTPEVDNAEAHIRPHLPRELREVFFTDGDRALSFIEGSRGDQMKRVEGAIRSLLGLGVVEEALAHTRKVSAELNQKVRADSGAQRELKAVSEKLSTLQEQAPELESQHEQAKDARLKLEDLAEEADRRLSDALRKGNREELEEQRKAAAAGKQAAEKDAGQAARDHSNLFKSILLGKALLADPFQRAKAVLDKLHDQGKIPGETIPVLDDRLNQPTCICGESLDPSDPDAQGRRAHIQKLIDESRASDAIQEKVTALYYGAQDLLRPIDGDTWSDEFSQVFERRQRAHTRQRDLGEQEAAIDAKIAALPDVDIQQLKATRDRYRSQAKDALAKELRYGGFIETNRRETADAEALREKLLQHDERGSKISAELEVAHDLQQILSNALETMKTTELQKVSEKMNSLFLDMIGADPSQRSIIARAEITSDFRIVVFGRFDNPLDPSQDLNGASRRALTIAFILALTSVSEVEAPNVIDTPLGMMSGYVKREVLRLAAEQSSQLILFLTHSEIAGCEDILDQRAGRIYTLTNPAHYPKILVNDPGTNDIGVLLCDCDHRDHCDQCERREERSATERVAVEA